MKHKEFFEVLLLKLKERVSKFISNVRVNPRQRVRAFVEQSFDWIMPTIITAAAFQIKVMFEITWQRKSTRNCFHLP
jgi:hypothetical protein